MKKILIFTFLTLLSFTARSQSPIIDTINPSNFPEFYIQNGDTVGVIITISEAQRLDNDAELLDLFKNLQINCDTADVKYISVIDTLNNQVALLQLKTSVLQNENNANDTLITDLKTQIIYYQDNLAILNSQISNDSKIISNLKKELLGQKLRKVFGFIGTGVLAAILAGLIIIHN